MLRQLLCQVSKPGGLLQFHRNKLQDLVQLLVKIRVIQHMRVGWRLVWGKMSSWSHLLAATAGW